MKEYNYLPTQFNDRIHGFAIDYGLVFLILLINIFMQYHAVYDPFIKISITFIAWYILNIAPSIIKKGVSLGKLNSKTIVLKDDYSEVSLLTMHMRELFILVIAIITFGLYFIIALSLLEKRLDKRAIHDLVFRTRVVNVTPFIEKRQG